MNIDSGNSPYQPIPTMEEVFGLLYERLKIGMKLNIELKNSYVLYEGMEETIVDLVHRTGTEDSVVYLTFYTGSLEKIRKLDLGAEFGILDIKASDCMYKLKGICIRRSPPEQGWILGDRDTGDYVYHIE